MRIVSLQFYFLFFCDVSAVISAAGNSGIGTARTASDICNTMPMDKEEERTTDVTFLNVVNEEDTEWGRAINSPLHEPSKIIYNDDNKECDVDITDSSGNADYTNIQEDVDVAIIGGGLAGLAVAIGLGNEISCKVYERTKVLRSHSQGILALTANGMKALESIHPSIPNLVEEAGCERRVLVRTVINEDGTTSETRDESFGEDYFKKHGRYKIGMTWHKLQQALASLVPGDIIQTNKSLQSFTELDNSVLLHFASGDTIHTVRAKAVIACDGIFSVTRRQIAPNDNPIWFGQLNWGSIIETSKLPSGLHPENAVHLIQHEGFPRWMSMLNDGGSGYTFWQTRVADPELAITLSGNNGRGGLGLKGSKQRLLSIVKPSKDVFSAIVNIPENQIFERSIVSRNPLKTWRSKGGLVVLVGDSAHGMHPNIGQGANSAFESAAAVVHALINAKLESDNDNYNWRRRGLERFESTRKPRADIVQCFANLMGVTQATGMGIEELLSISISQHMKMMYDWIVFSKDPKPKNDADINCDDDLLLDDEMLETLMKLDPCDYPGISEL